MQRVCRVDEGSVKSAGGGPWPPARGSRCAFSVWGSTKAALVHPSTGTYLGAETMPLRLPIATLLITTTLGGCAAFEPAPEDLDAVLHYAWMHYDAGLDEELAQALENAYAAIDGDPHAEPIEGTISDLTPEALEVVGMPGDLDPGVPAGMLLVDTLPCTMDQIAAVLTVDDLAAAYPDEYALLERGYTSDAAAFRGGTDPVGEWATEYHDELLGKAYQRSHLGGGRWVPGVFEHDAIVQRSWLPDPALWPDSTTYYWDQDYQLDLYIDGGDGHLTHLLALWRSVGSESLSSDAEFMQTMILRSKKGWDERTAELCTDGTL